MPCLLTVVKELNKPRYMSVKVSTKHMRRTLLCGMKMTFRYGQQMRLELTHRLPRYSAPLHLIQGEGYHDRRNSKEAAAKVISELKKKHVL